MIIHSPEKKIINSEIYYSSKVEFSTMITGMPETLCFRFPESYKDYITNSSNGFAASLLTLAMCLGEDMEIRGVLSPKLLFGMREYSNILNIWFPKQTKKINIRCNNLMKHERKDNKGAVACSFSGGVDSFNTLWTHLNLNENIPDYRISHTLFVHGFDISLEEENNYSDCKQAYDKLMNELGFQLLTAKTNIRNFLDKKADWGYLAHGSALAGSVLMLEGLISCFFIPSSHDYKSLVNYGSHPLTDPLLSTETLEIINDGGVKTRFEKTKTISNWTKTYPYLHVCWKKPNGLLNCCHCEKCIRTMLALKLSGTLHKYNTFPFPLERKDIRKCRYTAIDLFEKYLELMKYAIKIKKYDMAYDIFYSLCVNGIVKVAVKTWKMIRP